MIHAFLAKAHATLPPSAAVAGVYAQVDRTAACGRRPRTSRWHRRRATGDRRDDGLRTTSTSTPPAASRSTPSARSAARARWCGAPARSPATTTSGATSTSAASSSLSRSRPSKATNAVVFEPNDATTWLKVEAMIENFLIALWRDGALLGTKPEPAFYVHVGLGQTMTRAGRARGADDCRAGLRRGAPGRVHRPALHAGDGGVLSCPSCRRAFRDLRLGRVITVRNRPGLARQLEQFTLLVVVNAFVGAMVGLERTVLPVIATDRFHIASATAIMSFIATLLPGEGIQRTSRPDGWPTGARVGQRCCSVGSWRCQFRC